MEEFEVKFLNIDPVAIEKRILELGGSKKFDRLYRRVVFDYEDLRLDKAGAWVRVRDEGDKVTMSFKQRTGIDTDNPGANDGGMLEEEVEVSDFNTAVAIMRHIGLTDKFYIENRRVQFDLGGTEIDIEYWPLLEPYLEIEGNSWAAVDEAIEKLGFDHEDKKVFSTTQIYALKGINDKDYARLTFSEQTKK